MQRVTNCILLDQDRVLMIKKPRRGWWYSPGGKMEMTETISEAVIREISEETGLTIQNPELKGIFTIVVEEDGAFLQEWMLFTFFAKEWVGTPLEQAEEGELKWQPIDHLQDLLMAEGDRIVLKYILEGSGLLIGRFVYTTDYELISYKLDVTAKPSNDLTYRIGKH